MILKSLFGLVAFVSLHDTGYGQSLADDSSFTSLAFKKAAIESRSSWGNAAPWSNGKMYFHYEFSFEKGSPFFQSEKLQDGTLVYEGIQYDNVPLLLDQLSNRLVTKTEYGMTELINERVDGFAIGDAHFQYVYDAGIPSGYYQVIYLGNTPVFKRYKKTVEEVPTVGVGVIHNISDQELYYIKKGGSYVNVKNTKTLINALGSHQEDLQKFIKSGKLRWKKDKERLLNEVVSYYDQLNSK